MRSERATLTLVLLTLFGYANLLCVAGEPTVVECEREHGAPADHPGDCSKDSCFCLTMNTVVTQTTVTKPVPTESLGVVEYTWAGLPDVAPVMQTVVTYAHGPPAIAPPIFLRRKTVSPRSPPPGV